MEPARFPFHLQAVTRSIAPVDDVAAMLIGVLGAGADSVQLRDAHASATQASALIEMILRELPDAADRIVVHQRLVDPGAAAVQWRHLPSGSLGMSKSALDFHGRLFGASVHAVIDARMAIDLGAAYLTFGHVFPTVSHPGEPARGIAALADIVNGVDIPVLAIGGIHVGNLDAVLATGCAGVAVISAVLSRPDPAAATRELRDRLDDSPYRPRRPLVMPALSLQKGTP